MMYLFKQVRSRPDGVWVGRVAVPSVKKTRDEAEYAEEDVNK